MEHIERKVRSLVNDFDTNDPFKIAKNLSIEIMYHPLGNIMGYYSKHFGTKIIHLNESLAEEEMEFVCAHELGHAIQHPDTNTPFLKRNTLFSTEKIEQEANVFALNLLFLEWQLDDPLLIEIALNKYGIPQKLLTRI